MSIDGIPFSGGVSQSEFDALKRQTETFGAITTTESVGSQTLTAATPAKLVLFTADGLANNTTPSHTNDQITVLETGEYNCEFTASGEFSVGAINLIAHLAIDGARQEPGLHRRIAAGGDIGNFTTGEIPLSLTAGEVITVEVESSGNGDLTLIDAILRISWQSGA